MKDSFKPHRVIMRGALDLWRQGGLPRIVPDGGELVEDVGILLGTPSLAGHCPLLQPPDVLVSLKHGDAQDISNNAKI